MIPINQEFVTKVVLLDSKLSTSLYDRMGEDVKVLKKAVETGSVKRYSSGHDVE